LSRAGDAQAHRLRTGLLTGPHCPVSDLARIVISNRGTRTLSASSTLMLNVVSPLKLRVRQHMEEGKHVEDCFAGAYRGQARVGGSGQSALRGAPQLADQEQGLSPRSRFRRSRTPFRVFDASEDEQGVRGVLPETAKAGLLPICEFPCQPLPAGGYDFHPLAGSASC
jgi:hypothetical protein